MAITRIASRIALIGIVAISFAACSSDTAKKTEEKLEKEVREAKEKAEKKAEEAKAAATAAAKNSASTPAAPTCATEAEATSALGSKGTATGAPFCEDGFAAGSATNGEFDFAYALQSSDGTWSLLSEGAQKEICTVNPGGFSQEFVNDACDD